MAHPEILIDDNESVIFVLSNKPEVLILMDKEDYFKHVHNTSYWYVHFSCHQRTPKPYVRSNWVDGIGHKHLHREVLGLKENWNHDSVADHINGDSLDIRKINLRKCTTAENVRARFQKECGINYRGIAITPVRNNTRFQAYAKLKYYGSHKTIEGIKAIIDEKLKES